MVVGVKDGTSLKFSNGGHGGVPTFSIGFLLLTLL